MFVEDQAQPTERRKAAAAESNARNDFRASAPSFTAFAHLEGDRAIVMLHGELDVSSIAILVDSILIDCFMGIAVTLDEVVLDFSELDFVDGSGLHAIAVAAQQVAAYGGSLSIRSPRTQIQRMLEILDFRQIVAVNP